MFRKAGCEDSEVGMEKRRPQGIDGVSRGTQRVTSGGTLTYRVGLGLDKLACKSWSRVSRGRRDRMACCRIAGS